MKNYSINFGACLSLLIFQSQIMFSQDLPCKAYFKESGRCSERYNEDTGGNIHGKYISYYTNGQKHKVCTYEHGVLNGSFEYYDGGNVKKGNYVKGEKDGYWIDEVEWKTYYDDSYNPRYVYAKGNYSNGKKEGEWILLEDIEVIKKRIIYNYQKEIYIPSKIIFSEDKSVKLYDSNGQDISVLVQSLEKQNEVIQQKEDINKAWEKCYSIKDFESFINKYPSDSRVAQAKERIACISAWGGSVEAIDTYIKDYPQSNLIKEIQDLKKFVDTISFPTVEETFEYREEDFKNGIIGKTILGNVTIRGLEGQIINSENLIETIALSKLNINIKYKREDGKLVFVVVNDDKFFIYENGSLRLFNGNNTYVFKEGNQNAMIYYFGNYGYSIEDSKGTKIYESYKDPVRHGINFEETYRTCGEELGELFIISYFLHHGEENIIQEFPAFLISLNEYYLKNNGLSKIDTEICYKLIDRLKTVGKEAWNSHSQLALILYLKGEKEKAIEVFKQRIDQSYENKTIDSSGKHFYKDAIKSYLSEKVHQGVITKDICKEIIKSVQ